MKIFTVEIDTLRIYTAKLKERKETIMGILDCARIELFSLAAATPTNGVDDEGAFFYSTDIVIEKADRLWEVIEKNIAELTLINKELTNINSEDV